MKINHDCKNNQLSDTLSTFLKKNINLAHIKLISLFIVALCKAKTVCFSLLSTVFDSPAKSSSCLRRIQRFFAEFDLDRDLIARRHLPPAAHKKPVLSGHRQDQLAVRQHRHQHLYAGRGARRGGLPAAVQHIA